MITCAATKLKINDGPEVVIPLHRHGDLNLILKAFGFKPNQGYKIIEQGFIDNKNVFYNRYDAFEEALRCNQISIEESRLHLLFSEDLY
jgi:hypothetical protein